MILFVPIPFYYYGVYVLKFLNLESKLTYSPPPPFYNILGLTHDLFVTLAFLSYLLSTLVEPTDYLDLFLFNSYFLLFTFKVGSEALFDFYVLVVVY